MGKGLKLLMLAMAAGLLWVGCVLPQEDDPLPFIPPAKNRPPRILLDLVGRTPGLITHNVDPACTSKLPPVCPYACATVEDPDVDDSIRVRWIVYEADGTRALGQIPDPMRLESGSVRRPQIVVPSTLFTTVGSLPNTSNGKARRLELIVADGEFEVGAGGVLTTVPRRVEGNPDGGAFYPDDNYMDSYTWVVDTIKDQTCP